MVKCECGNWRRHGTAQCTRCERLDGSIPVSKDARGRAGESVIVSELRASGRGLTSLEIATLSGLSVRQVLRVMSRMAQRGEVARKEIESDTFIGGGKMRGRSPAVVFLLTK